MAGAKRGIRVVFVQDLWFELLGVMMLSTALRRAGHEARAVVLRGRDVVGPVRAAEPDLIAFSAMSPQFPFVRRAARALKAAGVRAPIIVGGAHATAYPQIALLPEIDLVCRGEGEQAIVALADRRASGAPYDDVPNLCRARGDRLVKNPVRPFAADLDALGPPDRSLYDPFPFVWAGKSIPMIASRGCPFRCSFCIIPRLGDALGLGRVPLRFRSAASLLAEMTHAAQRRPVREFQFVDSLFALDRRWTLDFLERYRRALRLPFSCNVRADLVTEELAAALAEAGCVRVLFGVESGTEALRGRILGKGLPDARIRAAAACLRRHGIEFLTYNMFGLPGESVADAVATLRFNVALRPNGSAHFIYLPLPGTELAERARRSGEVPARVQARLARDGLPPARVMRSLLEAPDIGERENLQKFAGFVIRRPALLPVARRLAKLRPNRLFDRIGVLGWLLYAHPTSHGSSVGARLRRLFFYLRQARQLRGARWTVDSDQWSARAGHRTPDTGHRLAPGATPAALHAGTP